MKLKITLIVFAVALFGFVNANAQGKGKGKYKYDRYENRNDRYYDNHRYRHTHSRYARNVYHSPAVVYRVPPGHAKKLYGYRSAKAFAPGQQKKYYKNYHKRGQYVTVYRNGRVYKSYY